MLRFFVMLIHGLITKHTGISKGQAMAGRLLCNGVLKAKTTFPFQATTTETVKQTLRCFAPAIHGLTIKPIGISKGQAMEQLNLYSGGFRHKGIYQFPATMLATGKPTLLFGDRTILGSIIRATGILSVQVTVQLFLSNGVFKTKMIFPFPVTMMMMGK